MSEDRTPQNAEKYIVRFPEGMRDRLKAEAATNNRTLNAEIVLRLQESLSVDQAARSSPADLSAQLAQMQADQKLMMATTRLQLAQMRVENAAMATRSLTAEIRQMKEALAAAERLGLHTQNVDELRGRLRIAEDVLPQHHDLIRAAEEEVRALQGQIAATPAQTIKDRK